MIAIGIILWEGESISTGGKILKLSFIVGKVVTGDVLFGSILTQSF